MTVQQRFLDVVGLVDTLFAKHGISRWTFKFDRSKRSYGKCYVVGKRITLSRYYCADLDNDIDDIKDVILHEIAHALQQERHPHLRPSHGIVWRSIAKEIGCKTIKASGNKGKLPKGKFQAFCPKCGDLQFFRHRMGAAMKQGRYRCPKCRSSLQWRL